MDERELINRRTLLKNAALAAALPLVGMAAARAAMPAAPALVPLTPADPTAKALGYTENSAGVDEKANPTHKADQKCATCVQFKGKPGDARGGCNLFPGKSVNSGGWCRTWAKKP